MATEEEVTEAVSTQDVQDESTIKKNRAEKFKKEHGYSYTTHKLMQKYNCKSVTEYREVRKKNKKEILKRKKVAEKPAPKPVAAAPAKKR